VVITVFLLFLGLAVNAWVALPTSIEIELAGARLMFAGVGNVVVVVGPLLLQPVKDAIKPSEIKIRPSRTRADNLPMHPPRPDSFNGRAC
jgi:hypothetical protein